MTTRQEPCLEESEFASIMDKLLVEHSTQKYFILHNNGMFFNHMAHGLVALHHLGVSEEALENFAEAYGSLLDRPEKYEKDGSFNPDSGVQDLMGKKKGYYFLVDHYERLLKEEYSDSLEEIVRCEFPKLKRGIGAFALHGLIHVGYGCTARCARVVCEGLAFLHYACEPLTINPGTFSTERFGKGDKEVTEVLEMVRNDKTLQERVHKMVKELDPTVPERDFQHQMIVLLAHMGDSLSRYVQQIRLTEIFEPEIDSPGMPDIKAKLLKWAVDCAIIMFGGADRHNDFFLLHGVTSAWSLMQVMTLFDDPEEIINTMHTYLCCIFAVYIAENCPKVSVNKLLSDAKEANMTWETIIERAIATHPDGGQEHIYKLVQVCWDMHKTYPGSNMEGVYKQAAISSVTNELVFM